MKIVICAGTLLMAAITIAGFQDFKDVESYLYHHGRRLDVSYLLGYGFMSVHGKRLLKSGGGKSTLLNIIGTLETYDSGMLRCFSVDDPVKDRRKSERLRRYRIAYLFQNFALVEKMTVKENLLLALRYARVKNKTRAMEEALIHLGVADKMNSRIFELFFD